VGARASTFRQVAMEYDLNRRKTTMDEITAMALYENKQNRPSGWNLWPTNYWEKC
jgi:hypothetical protein